MNADSLVLGAFIGFLLSCFVMLVAPKPQSCAIEVKQGKITTVYVGTYE